MIPGLDSRQPHPQGTLNHRLPTTFSSAIPTSLSPHTFYTFSLSLFSISISQYHSLSVFLSPLSVFLSHFTININFTIFLFLYLSFSIMFNKFCDLERNVSEFYYLSKVFWYIFIHWYVGTYEIMVPIMIFLLNLLLIYLHFDFLLFVLTSLSLSPAFCVKRNLEFKVIKAPLLAISLRPMLWNSSILCSIIVVQRRQFSMDFSNKRRKVSKFSTFVVCLFILFIIFLHPTCVTKGNHGLIWNDLTEA